VLSILKHTLIKNKKQNNVMTKYDAPIKITKTTRTKLKQIGIKGQTYNDIILNLIKTNEHFYLPAK